MAELKMNLKRTRLEHTLLQVSVFLGRQKKGLPDLMWGDLRS